jgi:hypothetical protein
MKQSGRMGGMDKNNPDFMKIRQWVFAASLAALSGIGIGYINDVQGTCTQFQIPCNIVIIVISTLLFFVFLQITEWVWKNIQQLSSRFSASRALRREQQKVMTITIDELHLDKLNLRIHNNEDSYILINKVVVDHQSTARSRISSEPNIRVELGKTQTISFITEDAEAKPSRFVIIGYLDNDTTNNIIYGRGMHEFRVGVVYYSDEKKTAGLIERFRVIVNYKDLHKFDVEIDHTT